jgi:nuclear transport factor 2 (NTF2) superfamily protein
MNDPAELRDFAKRYKAAWCSQDPAGVAAFYSADGSLSVNDNAPAVGRAAIAEVAQGFMTTFPDLVILLDDLVIRGERVEYHWTLVGTNGGRKVRVSGFEVWEIGADGLIAESRGSFDSGEYQRQMEGSQ